MHNYLFCNHLVTLFSNNRTHFWNGEEETRLQHFFFFSVHIYVCTFPEHICRMMVREEDDSIIRESLFFASLCNGFKYA